MFTKRMVAGTLTLACFTLSAPASAGYLGAAFSKNTVSDWNEGFIQDGSLSNTSSEDSDTGFRVLGGGEFSPNLGFEVGYSDFGEATTKGTSDGSVFWAAGPVKGSAGVKGFDASLVGRLPTSESLSLLARLGVLKWDADFKATDSSGSLSDSDSGSDTFFGLGAEFGGKGPTKLRAEWTKYKIDSSAGDNDVTSLSLSLVYYMAN